MFAFWSAESDLNRVDAALVLLAFVVAAASWLACVPWFEVTGDAALPIECGWMSLETAKLLPPSQPIYGYGLCLGGAATLAFATDMLDVARNRALAGAALVPLVFIAVRVLAPRIVGASVPAARIGALATAALLARHAGLVASGVSYNGYLAVTWIALALACWAVASARSAPVALVLGFAAVPMAVMNHPFAIWLAVTGLVLLPVLVHTTGWRAMIAAGVAWGLLAAPAVGPLLSEIGSRGDLSTVASADVSLTEALPTTLGGLLRPADLALTVGLLFLPALAWRRRDSSVARWWGTAAVASCAGLGATAAVVGTLRPHHLQLIMPLGALGLGVGVAASVERWAMQPGRAAVMAVGLASAGAVIGSWPATPWARLCTEAPPSVDTAAGHAIVQRAIADDAADSATAIVVSNLHLGHSSPDGAASVALGLYRGGVEGERLACCEAGQESTWYWIASGESESLDALEASAGVERLAGPPDVSERVLVARSSSARGALQGTLCGLPEGATAWTGSYRRWLSWMESGLGTDTLVPPDPLRCGETVAPPPLSEDDGVGRLRASLADAPFRWLRGPEDVGRWVGGRTVVLQVFDCLEYDQLAAMSSWLDRIEDRERRRGTAMLSVLLSPQPEYRDPRGELLCGLPHGESRALGLALDGTLKLDLGIDGTPRTFIYDSRGRLRGRYTEYLAEGVPAAAKAEALLDALYAEGAQGR